MDFVIKLKNYYVHVPISSLQDTYFKLFNFIQMLIFLTSPQSNVCVIKYSNILVKVFSIYHW